MAALTMQMFCTLCARCAYQKLDLVESWVGDGFWKTRAVRLNSTALVLFSQSRAVIDGPSRNRRL
jgi:hypothetical protein